MAEVIKEGGSAIKRKRNCGQEVYTKEKSGRRPHRHIGGPSTELLPLNSYLSLPTEETE